MASKQSFTPEEWTKLLESSMLAGMAVTAAEPSGLWGSMKEAFASSAVLAKSRQDPGTNELVKAVIAEFESPEGRAKLQKALKQRLEGANAGEIVKRSLDNLREVAAILDAKAPDDAAAYKAWLQGISQKVAEAAKEGGTLGLGGVKVSDAEKLALEDIAKALGTA
jgi:hypothetical protein